MYRCASATVCDFRPGREATSEVYLEYMSEERQGRGRKSSGPEGLRPRSREASRARAPGSPSPGECMDARTARPFGGYFGGWLEGGGLAIGWK